MAWFTEILNPEVAPLVSAERRMPYAVSLLLAENVDNNIIASKAANWGSARRAQTDRARKVAHAPYHAVLDPSNVCNLRCPLCVQATDPDGRRRSMVEVEAAITLIRQLAASLIRLDLFNWGEPLLHPHFSNIVAAAGQRGIFTRTSSHMSHRHTVDWEAIVASGLRYIVASIDGATQETYARYRVNGRLHDVISNVQALTAAKQRIGRVFPLLEWQFLAFKHNVHELQDVRAMAAAIGADLFRYGGARGRMATKTLTSTPQVVKDSGDILLDADHPLSEYDGAHEKFRVREREGCSWLWSKMSLHPDGGVSPCWNGWFERFDLGQWDRRDVLALWRSSHYEELRARVAAGGSAHGDSVCERCAFNQSYVPPPDFDGEPMPDRAALDEVAHALRQIGLTTNMSERAEIIARSCRMDPEFT
jgi:radical SAM protein with 4Fe4S-binding SPASM domain